LAGPPHVDLTYILPEAKSAISYALLFNREKIRQFLKKESFANHEKNNADVNIASVIISMELASWLKEEGYDAKHVLSNNEYKKEIKDWRTTMPPPLSHRYVAVASGVGSFGWSGNVGIKGIGTTILLGTVVTTAELKPTEPIPPEESFCTRCKICANVCVAQTFSKDEEVNFTLGGHEYSHAKRNEFVRCQFVCGGFTGLHPSKKWSTWSFGRFPIPKTNTEIHKMWGKALRRYPTWPKRELSAGFGGVEHELLPGYNNIRLTCGMCQIICWENAKDTAENYKLLTHSGCVIQNEDGSFEVLPSEEAEKYFQSLPKKHRNKYYIKTLNK